MAKRNKAPLHVDTLGEVVVRSTGDGRDAISVEHSKTNTVSIAGDPALQAMQCG